MLVCYGLIKDPVWHKTTRCKLSAPLTHANFTMMLVICNTPWFHSKSMNVLSSVPIKKVRTFLCRFPRNSKILYGITCRALASEFTQTGQCTYRNYGSHTANIQESRSHLVNLCNNLLYQIVSK